METKTIWKYMIPVEDQFVVSMPKNAQVLTVQSQYGHPVIWVLVDLEQQQPKEDKSFRLSGTGHPISATECTKYIGSFQLSDGSLVFHLFEIENNNDS